MRALPVCLLALMLSGCSMLSRSPVEPVQSTVTPPAKSEPAKPKATRPAPVRIYTDATELVGKPFRELGEVTGESCQPRIKTLRPISRRRASACRLTLQNESQCRAAAPLRSDQRNSGLLPPGRLPWFSA